MDIVIIGTGVSALLLAQSLVRRRCVRTLRLIGPARRLRAHRLSYWADVQTPFDGDTEASWARLRVVDDQARALDVPLERFVYRTMPAEDWARGVRAELLAAPGVELVEAAVDSVRNGEDRAIVRAGSLVFEADWAFSSGRPSGQAPTCWQRFLGWEVELREPLPDTGAATLLDFRTPAGGDFRFVYALPLSSTRLFVEHVSYRPCDHALFLAEYLRDVIGASGWELVDREGGATPLFRDPPLRRAGRIVQLGVAGGLAKATTGYALMRMWRDAERIAQALLQRGRPRLPFRRLPTLYRVADHFFLDALERSPTSLPPMMSALFGGASGDAVLAFLDDQARFKEQRRVARAMPGWLRWLLTRRLDVRATDARGAAVAHAP